MTEDEQLVDQLKWIYHARSDQGVPQYSGSAACIFEWGDGFAWTMKYRPKITSVVIKINVWT